MTHPYRVLFLSQRNSARSIMAEAILNSIGNGRFVACSAGVRPTASVDPIVLELLEHATLPTDGLSPRHAAEFADAQAEPFDFIFTLSDTAAGEAPPRWPGQPITAHWRSTDPTRIDDPVERRHALIKVRGELERRLRVFINLPLASLDRMSAQRHVDAIGAEESERREPADAREAARKLDEQRPPQDSVPPPPD
jgi:arsenate reductase (thioredoxin)